MRRRFLLLASVAVAALAAKAPAMALPTGLKAVLFAPPRPKLRLDFAGTGVLDPRITFSRASNATMFDSTGKLTWAPNNQLLNSATLSTQNVTTILTNYVLSFYGTGTVTLSGTSVAGPLVGTGANDRVSLAFSPSAGTLTLTVSGSVTSAQLELVTYETTPSAYVATAGAIYYGPRFDYNPSDLTARGLLAEEPRTNVVLWNRDLTNAAWTLGVTMTRAKDQTGIDGVANSASSITGGAVSATNTILQAITLASSARLQSAYVKRLVGSGTVNMTTDGGATWTAITVTASWTKVTIPVQTLANPSVGFQITTNADSIAVDMTQNETGTFPTSSIPTTTASVTRAAEVVVMTGTNFSSWYNRTVGAFLVDFEPSTAVAQLASICTTNLTSSFQEQLGFWKSDLNNSTSGLEFVASSYDSGNPSVISTAGLAAATTNRQILGLAYANLNLVYARNGVVVGTKPTFTLPSPDRFHIGNRDGGFQLNGWIKNLTYYRKNLSNGVLAAKTLPGSTL